MCKYLINLTLVVPRTSYFKSYLILISKTMKKFFFLIGALTFLASCKKYGCTDPIALNYSSRNTEDDGSCVYDDAPQDNVTIEAFTINFGPSNQYPYYVPAASWSSGDYVTVQVLNEVVGGEEYWSDLPYVSNDITIYFDYGNNDQTLYFYGEYVSTGNAVTWSNDLNLGARLVVIK